MSTAAASMPGKWRNVILLAVAEVLSLSVWFSGAATLPAIRAEVEISALQASLYTSMLSVGFVFGTLVSAILGLADRLRPQTFFTVAALVSAAANAAVIFLDPTSPVVPALRFVIGICMAGTYPVGMKMISTWARADMGVLTGLLVGALTLGSGSPHLVQAFLGGLDWRLTLAATSGCALVGAILVQFFRLGPNAIGRAAFKPSAVLDAWRNKPLRLANLGYFGHMWELYAVWGWMVVFLTASFAAWFGAGDPRVPVYASTLTFGVLAIGALGALSAGFAADRIGRTAVTIIAMGCSAGCCVAAGFLFGAAPWIIVPFCLFWGVAVIADSAQFSASVMELADPRRVGTMVTAQTCVGFVLTLFAIHLLPVAVDHVGWEWAFWCVAIGPLLGMWAMARLRAHPDAVRIAGGRR